MSLDDATLIEHILEQCRRICRLTSKISFDEFLDEPIYQDALTRELEISVKQQEIFQKNFVKSTHIFQYQ